MVQGIFLRLRHEPADAHAEPTHERLEALPRLVPLEGTLTLEPSQSHPLAVAERRVGGSVRDEEERQRHADAEHDLQDEDAVLHMSTVSTLRATRSEPIQKVSAIVMTM